MFSNMLKQLKDAGQEDKLQDVLEEIPRVLSLIHILFRGQHMLGYRPYADDAVEYFVQKSVANGIGVISGLMA